MRDANEFARDTGPVNQNEIEWRRGRVLVLGMTYPHYSEKYAENVCTGGILEETNSLVRIHPLPQRYLDSSQRLRAFQWITVDYQKHRHDSRPESIRVNPGTIQCGEVIPSRSHEERRSFLESCTGMVGSVENLKRRWTEDRTSLGIVTPAEILDVRLEKRSNSEMEEWNSKARKIMSQQRMTTCIGNIKNIDFPSTKFMIKWRCDDRDCQRHEMCLEDWGIHELWRKLEGDRDRDKKIIDRMRANMNARMYDLYFFLGNFLGIQWNFGLMGVCHLNRAERVKQMSFGF